MVSRRAIAPSLTVIILCTACGGSADVAEPGQAPVALALSGLRALDSQTEGSYHAWFVAPDRSVHSGGRFSLPPDGRIEVRSPITNAAEVYITVEPPSGGPSGGARLLGGAFHQGSATLDIVGYVTSVSPLETDPGAHALFTPSDNGERPYPSDEDAGIWIFAPRPAETVNNNHFIMLSALTAGWTYEGWIVHDYGSAAACWVSYGKFLPDQFRLVGTRDDTGLGPFSGQPDYLNALPLIVDMPGDDWVSNIHGLPTPCGLALPFDLNGDRSQGIPSRWTHVITIEPIFDKGEDPLAPRPFLIQPYRNAIGEGPPSEGRIVLYHPELVPSGIATAGR